jgi:Protein of unknown function (DUF2924)/SOS response associated peptidase (SRAP)
MPRVGIGPALPDRDELDVEIARLRDLDVNEPCGRWQAVFGRPTPPHLPRHLVFRMVAYQLQAERFGDLDAQSRRLLDHSETPEKAGRSAASVRRSISELRAGTTLGSDWAEFGRIGRTSGEWVRTFAIITTDADETVAEIHDRMPLILAPNGVNPTDIHWIRAGLCSLSFRSTLLLPATGAHYPFGPSQQ